MSEHLTLPLKGKHPDWQDRTLVKEVADLMRNTEATDADIASKLARMYRHPFTKNMVSGLFHRDTFLKLLKEVADDADNLLRVRSARAVKAKASQGRIKSLRGIPPTPSRRPIASGPRLVPTADTPPPDAVALSLKPMRLESGKAANVETLSDCMCKFPIGDPTERSFGFCGRAVTTKPYCDDHRRLTYIPPQTKNKEAQA